jgi:hypothetical protein
MSSRIEEKRKTGQEKASCSENEHYPFRRRKEEEGGGGG